MSGVYWFGADGNIWWKDGNGKVTNQGKPMGYDANGKLTTNAAAIKKGTKWENGFDSQYMSAAAKRIDDPNPPKKKGGNNNTNNNNKNSYTNGGGGGTVYPDMSGAIAILRQNIAALDPLYNAEVEKANKEYEIANNERISNYKKSKAASDASGVTNDQGVLTSRNDIDKNAYISSKNIASILSALGAGGSSTHEAIGRISDKSNKDMNSANYGYGKNKQNILQAWNDFVNADKNQQIQLQDAKNYGIAQAGITRNTAKKTNLAQIAADMNAGGNFNTKGILDELAGVNSDTANLAGVKKAYTGVTPVYTAPAISAILGNNMAKFDVGANSNSGKSTPRLIKVNEQTPSGDKYGIT